MQTGSKLTKGQKQLIILGSTAVIFILLLTIQSFSLGYPRLEVSLGDELKNRFGKTKSGAEVVMDNEYVLIYFSASWCPPCRKFTPKLVKFYKKYKDKYDFEVVMVTSDYSNKEMKSYMKKYRMPWLTVPFENYWIRNRLDSIYGGGGIPNLILVDKKGKVLSSSYMDGYYVGPNKVLLDLKKL